MCAQRLIAIVAVAMVGCHKPKPPSKAASPAIPTVKLESFDAYATHEPAAAQKQRLEAMKQFDAPGDHTAAFQLLRESCHADSAAACCEAGFRMSQGDGVEKNPEASAKLYSRACDLGFALGCADYALRLSTGDGVTKDLPLARALAGKSCDAKESLGCQRLGELHEEQAPASPAHPDAEPELVQALGYYQRSCELGEDNGCLDAAIMFENGRGAAKSEAKALPLYAKACDGEIAQGCYGAGWALNGWPDVPRDSARAASFYEKACPGYPIACTNLGLLYATGDGVRRNPALGAKLHQEACDAEVMVGCEDLGDAYTHGRGVKKDVRKARALYEQACEAVPDACASYAQLAELGAGGARNHADAQSAYARACDNGVEGACDALDEPDLDAHADDEQKCSQGLARPCTRVAFAMLDKIEASNKKRGLEQKEGESDEAYNARVAAAAEDKGFDFSTISDFSSLNKATNLFKKACKGGDDIACRAATKLAEL